MNCVTLGGGVGCRSLGWPGRLSGECEAVSDRNASGVCLWTDVCGYEPGAADDVCECAA